MSVHNLATAADIGALDTITPLNYRPVAVPVEATTAGEPIDIQLIAEDANGDATVLSIESAPSDGTLSEIDQNTARVTYSPGASFIDSDEFTYIVSDGSTESFPASVRILLDVEEDGIADIRDNCLNIQNVDQRDTNGDGFGNICDGDLNNNGLVETQDLGALRAAFGTSGPDLDADF